MKIHELQEFTAGLLGRLGIKEHRVSVIERARETVLNIELPELPAVLLNNSEALRALNTVVRRVAERQPEAELLGRLRVDINNHDTGHIEFLENQAHILAERARSLKRDIAMSPANPYDRMITHEALRDSVGIKTESEGEGSLRHVVIRFVP